MSNSVTDHTALPISVFGIGPVHPHTVVIDTNSSDVTVHTPATGNMAALVGLVFSDATSGNLTIKSGSTTLVVLELAANQGVYDEINKGILLCTQPGEALIFNSSFAGPSSVLVSVIEAPHFEIGR